MTGHRVVFTPSGNGGDFADGVSVLAGKIETAVEPNSRIPFVTPVAIPSDGGGGKRRRAGRGDIC